MLEPSEIALTQDSELDPGTNWMLLNLIRMLGSQAFRPHCKIAAKDVSEC